MILRIPIRLLGCTGLSMVLGEASLIGIEVYSGTSPLSVLNGFSLSFLSFCEYDTTFVSHATHLISEQYGNSFFE